MVVRDFSALAMNNLVARARAGDVDLDYLLDALEHYRRQYALVNRAHDDLYESARMLVLKIRDANQAASDTWAELEGEA